MECVRSSRPFVGRSRCVPGENIFRSLYNRAAKLKRKGPIFEPNIADRYGVRITEPILDAMGVEHHLIEQPQDVAKIGPAIDKAYDTSSPVVLLIGRRLDEQ